MLKSCIFAQLFTGGNSQVIPSGVAISTDGEDNITRSLAMSGWIL